MEQTNVTQFRERLQHYLALARNGERVVVTSHGRAVATLGPPLSNEHSSQAARQRLRASVLRFAEPLAPAVEAGDWEINR